MQTIMKSHNGWAIDSCSNEGHGLIDRHWWFYGEPSVLPKQLEGYSTALFRTRKQARQILQNVRRTFPEAKVVHVQVDISV